MTLLLVALGGALGATARWGLGVWIHVWAGTAFPWGTFAVNVVGSFLLGFSFRYLEAVAVGPELRILVTVGFLGAFTTFSAFSFETLALLQEGAWVRGVAYAGGSVLLGLVGVVAGVALAGFVLRGLGGSPVP